MKYFGDSFSTLRLKGRGFGVGVEGMSFLPGTYFASLGEGEIRYGKVLDPVHIERKAGATAMELAYMRELYRGEKRGLRLVDVVVAGYETERGDIPVADLSVALSREEFLRAQSLGWPSSIVVFWEDVMQLPEMLKTEVFRGGTTC